MASIDTIFALSTGRPPSGIAVIRMSGPQVRGALTALSGSVPEPRVARYGPLRAEGSIIDYGICLYFPSPNSVTGEDCGEFHVHGGVAVVNAVLGALADLGGCRLAEAGEFTRRAFLNGRMDLTGVEGLSDLIAAETETQRRMAVDSTSGRLRDLYLAWRTEILHMRAGIEAEMDFSDQDDVSESLNSALPASIVALVGHIDRHLARYRQSEIIRNGYRVVIIGAPNAGKSSLLNALTMRDVAIVTAEPGTTRDLIEVSLDLGGYKVVMTDTAGIRVSEGMVESIGIERALAAATLADLVLLVEDMSAPGRLAADAYPNVVRVGSKVDLVGRSDGGGYDVRISTRSGEGIGDLLSMVTERARLDTPTASTALPLRDRHVMHLRSARDALGRAIASDKALELRAEDLRGAAQDIGRIVGMTDTEELLGEIFGQFCIGK